MVIICLESRRNALDTVTQRLAALELLDGFDLLSNDCQLATSHLRIRTLEPAFADLLHIELDDVREREESHVIFFPTKIIQCDPMSSLTPAERASITSESALSLEHFDDHQRRIHGLGGVADQ